ncbi:MAG: hypothetical protein ACYCZZ_00330 [Minisyncoccota bacterium]
MSNQPLHPFSPPAALLSYLPNGLTPDTLVAWALYLVFAFWALYTLVAIYHWLKYSHASRVAFPAIAVHLLVSFALMAYALSGTIVL